MIGQRHKLGTVVQHRNGYIYVKTEEGMVSENRRVWDLTFGHKDPIKPGDKVHRRDGDRTNNSPENLAKIHYNQTKFVFLKKARILFEPKKAEDVARVHMSRH